MLLSNTDYNSHLKELQLPVKTPHTSNTAFHISVHTNFFKNLKKNASSIMFRRSEYKDLSSKYFFLTSTDSEHSMKVCLIVIIVSHLHLLGMLSIPADFPFFSDCTAACTSLRRMGWSFSVSVWGQFSTAGSSLAL